MSRKPDYSKKILKTLAQKPAISLPDLIKRLSAHTDEKKAVYAISRSIRGLHQSGLIEKTSSGRQDYARLTKDGKKKLYSVGLEHEGTMVNPAWDGKWRIILLDIPESRKDEREALRYLLKKAGFVCLKNSVWVSPLPYEHLFSSIKRDFGFTTELIIFVTDTLDEETKNVFFGLTLRQ